MFNWNKRKELSASAKQAILEGPFYYPVPKEGVHQCTIASVDAKLALADSSRVMIFVTFRGVVKPWQFTKCFFHTKGHELVDLAEMVEAKTPNDLIGKELSLEFLPFKDGPNAILHRKDYQP